MSTSKSTGSGNWTNNSASALRKVKGNIERMFDKSLTDLIRGIRNNKDNEVGWQVGLDERFYGFSQACRFRTMDCAREWCV